MRNGKAEAMLIDPAPATAHAILIYRKWSERGAREDSSASPRAGEGVRRARRVAPWPFSAGHRTSVTARQTGPVDA